MDNIESLISKTIYKASLYLDEFRWDEWLELCDKDFYYSIQAFSPEIDKNMIYLDGTYDQMKSMTEMLPKHNTCLLYTSPSPRDGLLSRMPSSA